MPLVFDERQLLLPGIHDATLEEVEQCFGRFQGTDRRQQLFVQLRAYLLQLNSAILGRCWVLIDGSFVMPGVAEPDDIDLILVLPASWDWDEELRPYQYNLISRHRVKKEYEIEIFTVSPGSHDEQKWIEFFARVGLKWCKKFNWPLETKKGLVRILP